ncbi:hypothetical protein BDW60DRAFT_224434 [Aspergillus nidulans var. acristatus]
MHLQIHPATVLSGLLAAATAVRGSTSHNTSAVYKSLYTRHSNSTPVFQNVSGQEANPLVRALQSPNNSNGAHPLLKRDELPVGTCAPGTPCVNGACCSNKGICGFSPDECGIDTCISNCDAKAECGQYAPSESATCPLNVCCSKYGFCGTTEDFCEAGCQKGYGGCGAVDEPFCGAGSMGRTIGYYEGWASTRSCDKRLPSDIDIEPLTHLNFAFAFFHPTTFQVLPMSAGDEALYPQFTALKSKKPSLKTWIAVGGWSFNDATNSPNTQTAFSDMAGSAANRQTFIASLRHFMQTWGFDGVDIDWEYPGADDRGGIDADTANFVKLVRDMKDAFGSEYGISVTLPASYWYLRGFDLQGMAAHVDFFNIMTYDIHGVWDADNKHTGPYVRPHTNITEIKQGLDLLWRNDVDPAQVNFGLGWYGRSFTLKDPSCNKPECIFAYGGKAGECTKSSGTLSNAEIQRIIAKHGLTPTVDADAMVKWITWDNDQWVSYDDGETIQMKINEASKLCLGGVLIWAVDQDGEDHTSSNDLMGVGPANGVSTADAKAYREAKQSMERGASISNSCYWTFCGDQCVSGFSEQAYAKGQVPHIDGDVSCSGDDVRTLCCAPGTSVGTCSWSGWIGVGMPCATEYCPSGSELIAMNTNSYVEDPELSVNSNLTCNGGAQSFCCSGFVPSQIANTDRLSLLGDPHRIPAETTDLALDTRVKLINSAPTACKILVTTGLLENDVVGRLGQGAAGIGMEQHKPSKPDSPENVATPNKEKEMAGEWTKVKYGKDDLDCQTTYTCRYGRDFDEICDNMRWAIEKGFNGEYVYHRERKGGRPKKTYKDRWDKQRKNTYYDGNSRCSLEEFPFASLDEAAGLQYQVIRRVNAESNAIHGRDWEKWLARRWEPCKRLRKAKGIEPPEPPITMTWSPFEEGDNRIKVNAEPPHNMPPHFIQAYGFDSQTGGVECFPTYTYSENGGSRVTKTLADHGFRALEDDP